MICLEQGCNMLTLCCGAACHMNCMAQWLSEAASPTCCACREQLPRPPPRPAPPAPPAPTTVSTPAPAAAADDATDDTTTDDTTTDDTTEDDDTTFTAQLNSMIGLWQAAPAQSDGEAAWAAAIVALVRAHPQQRAFAQQTVGRMDGLARQVNTLAGETLIAMPAPTDDTTTDDTTTDDTTTDATPHTDGRGRPVCRHCTNQPAPRCLNMCCGRCCVLHGQFHCPRHSC